MSPHAPLSESKRLEAEDEAKKALAALDANDVTKARDHINATLAALG